MAVASFLPLTLVAHLPRFPLSFVFRSLDLDLDLERDLDLLAIGLLFRVPSDQTRVYASLLLLC